ncbi:hypothetical protein TcCL_ESM07021 [Trypanosoma cruzi]|nr:hypothetical protein TcCL_ESM07021 [Trypanosoma cruzi]
MTPRTPAAIAVHVRPATRKCKKEPRRPETELQRRARCTSMPRSRQEAARRHIDPLLPRTKKQQNNNSTNQQNNIQETKRRKGTCQEHRRHAASAEGLPPYCRVGVFLEAAKPFQLGGFFRDCVVCVYADGISPL